MNKTFKLNLITFSIGLLGSSAACAAPWLDTNDQYLKASITALANAGIIKAPVNTYPLMYKSIADDIKKVHKDQVPAHLVYAMKHVEHALEYAQKERTTGVKLKAASSNKDFQSFGERHNAKGEISLFNEVIGNSWALKTSVQFTQDAQNNKKRNYEGSYFAGMFDNWVVSADQLSQWWGPGNDTTLALSNNAIAFPAVRLTRHNSTSIDLPVLNWLGPMSFTTYFGFQEHSNTLKHIRLWGARVNFKPLESLEIGLTRAAQWAGDNRPSGFSTFTDLLIGKDNAGVGNETTVEKEPGNQLAGIDLHYATNWLGQSWGIYSEIIGEDESGGMPSHLMYQLGAETSFGNSYGLYHAFVEYTNTFVDCGGDTSIGNCAYEHHIYPEGYRRYHRSMGSTYDSDANVLTFGLSRAQVGGISWFTKLKWMKLNKDNSNHWSGDHPITAVAEDRIQLEGGYRFPLLKGLVSLEASLYHSTQDATGASDTDGSVHASWEYRF